MSGEKDLDALSYVIKKVRRAVLRNSVDGELGKTQAECYGLLADLRGCISNYSTIAVVTLSLLLHVGENISEYQGHT